jgi:hypothetical protein
MASSRTVQLPRPSTSFFLLLIASSILEFSSGVGSYSTKKARTAFLVPNHSEKHRLPLFLRGGGSDDTQLQQYYGRISHDEYRLTPEQIEAFHRDGCITIPDLLTEQQVDKLAAAFERFVSGEIPVPGKDFCDISKPFGTPYEEWSLVNCMLPTVYYPPLRDNILERLTASMARQLFPHNNNMTKDYDQLLNKRPNKTDAIFPWRWGPARPHDGPGSPSIEHSNVIPRRRRRGLPSCAGCSS